MTMATDSYWILRAQRNENAAAKIAASMTKRVKALNKAMYRDLEMRLEALLKEVDDGKIPSRSELWRSKRYIELLNAIERDNATYRDGMVEATERAINGVYDSVIGRTAKDFASRNVKFAAVSDELKQQILKSQWLGSDYSKRIWHNTDALAEKLKTLLPDMILSGKDPRAELRETFNVDYRVASRLVHTESAHIYTEASKAQYRAANVKEVKFIAEADCCEICEQYRNGIFPLEDAPMIPQHPNCRCCLAPVITLE